MGNGSIDTSFDPYNKEQLADLEDEQLLEIRNAVSDLIAEREKRATAFLAAAGTKKKRGPRKPKTSSTK